MSLSIIEELVAKIGADKVHFGEALQTRYVHIWKMNDGLNATAVVLPRSVHDVSDILKLCHRHRQAVVVHGGLTGLTGATETTGDEVVISLEKMDRIIEVDPLSRTMTVEAGVILEHVQSAAEDQDLLFPLNFGAKGTAQIGGILSTNAGGLRVVKYGMTRNLVLGVEAVMADGTIISSMKKIIKDNSGYDLKQLFIGSEGTLGIITKATLKLSEAPNSRTSAFIGIDQYSDVISLLKFLDGGLSGTLTGYELIWADCYKAMTSPPALMKPPLRYGYNFYVLVESLGCDQEEDQAKLERLLEEAVTSGLIEDAAMTHTVSDMQWFWTIREDVHAFLSLYDHQQHFDISLPIPLIGQEVAKMIASIDQLEGVLKTFAFGHVADGNIHLIVGKEHSATDLTKKINDIVYLPLKAIGGSLSAEHGIGVHKKAYLSTSRSDQEIALMKLLKQTMDPHHILNMGKVFDLD